MVEIANRIELGQIRAGMVVSCETAREINEIVIDQMLRESEHGLFQALAGDPDRRLGGGGRPADRRLVCGHRKADRLLGGASRTAPQFHGLCRWGIEADRAAVTWPICISSPRPTRRPCSRTASSWAADLAGLLAPVSAGVDGQVDKVICHQVGSSHRETILKSLGIPESKDFSTFPYLGNMGTVSLPLTAALAEDREFLRARRPRRVPGDRQRAQLHDARRGMVTSNAGAITTLNAALQSFLADHPGRDFDRGGLQLHYSTKGRASRSSWSTATRPGRFITGT